MAIETVLIKLLTEATIEPKLSDTYGGTTFSTSKLSGIVVFLNDP